MTSSRSALELHQAFDKGFTLIELIIVMAILGILATLVVPAYQSVTEKLQRSEGQALLLEVQSHLERYYFEHRMYPKGLSELAAYNSDRVATEHDYFEVSLDGASTSCQAVHCYRLRAEHINKQKHEVLVIHSDGHKEGKW